MTGTTVQTELGGVVPFRVDTVPDDPDSQVAITVGLMRRYALASAGTVPLVHDLETARLLGNGDIIAGIHRLVRSALRFRNDEDTAAALQSPHYRTTVEVLVAPLDLSRAIAAGLRPAEDCDGFAMYVAALLATAGIPCSFVTVAADPDDPGHFSHVYVAAWPAPDVRIPVDASHGDYAGWECPNRYGRRVEWPLHDGRTSVVALLVIMLVTGLLATAKGRSAL